MKGALAGAVVVVVKRRLPALLGELAARAPGLPAAGDSAADDPPAT